MNKPIQITIAVLVSIAAILAFYFGSYAPLRKSQLYIEAYSSIGQIKSFQDFNSFFDPALDYSSPIGQDEVVSAYLGIMGGLLDQNPPPGRELTDVLVKQASQRADSIVSSGQGFLLSQNIYKLGMIYKIAAMRFEDPIYYNKAVDLFNLGLKFSPNRPIFLYNLLELYSSGGENDKGFTIAKTILKYWPNDLRVKNFVDQVESALGADLGPKPKK